MISFIFNLIFSMEFSEKSIDTYANWTACRAMEDNQRETLWPFGVDTEDRKILIYPLNKLHDQNRGFLFAFAESLSPDFMLKEDVDAYLKRFTAEPQNGWTAYVLRDPEDNTVKDLIGIGTIPGIT